MKKVVNILDTVFYISGEKEILNYIDYFQDCYDEGKGLVAENKINIEVHEAEVPKTINGEKIKIHTTKHDYWNFYGEYVADEGGRKVLWPGRNILITLKNQGIEIRYLKNMKANFIGESIYHALRGISLYKRKNENANFLHASGVTYNGKGILFTGKVGAGKTTLLLDMVKNMNAELLTNDRIFIKSNDKEVKGYSWPSYASFCEGTISEYKELKRLALEYEDNVNNKYRTQNWTKEISSSFTKDRKRTYPMMFLCDAFNKKFQRSSNINYIFLSHLDINNKVDEIRELEYFKDKNMIMNVLESQLFDNREPSFEPWHGLKIDNSSNTCEKFIENLRKNNCRIIYCDLNPNNIYKLNDFIKRVVI